jgi:phosphatidylglycerol:prolipoprotein diacylglycerol transferase
LYVLTNVHEFHDVWDVLALRRGGLVAYGGFLGGFVGSWWYLRQRGLSLLPWADVAVPSLASGLLLTRIGCYLFGCDFGKPLPTGAPGWLRRLGTFPRWPSDLLDGAGSPAWLQHVDQRGLSLSAQTSLPVHPTQLYEALAGALLLLMLWRLWKARRFAGESFFAFTFGYGYLRFWLELWRDDLERGSFGPALPEQLLMPALLLVFAAAFAYGPAHGIARLWLRRSAIALFALFALGAFWLLRPGPHAASVRAALSTSQWISLLSALAVAVAWHRRGPDPGLSALTVVEPTRG